MHLVRNPDAALLALTRNARCQVHLIAEGIARLDEDPSHMNSGTDTDDGWAGIGFKVQRELKGCH